MRYLAHFLFLVLPIIAMGFVASAFAVIALNDGAYFYALPMLALAGLCGAASAILTIEII